MDGYSGTYALNGINLLLPPTEGAWVQRDTVGMDGNGRPIYPSVREFAMKWELMPTSALKQIIDAQRATANTGSVVVDLPKWGDVDYIWYSYSGTFIQEVSVGAYFVDHVTDVNLVISNIRAV